MGRGISNRERNNLKVFTLKDVSIRYLCLFQKIKCAIVCCMFDFFYSLKEKHCRSPPSINSKN